MKILLWILLVLFSSTFIRRLTPMYHDKYPVKSTLTLQRAVVHCLFDIAMMGALVYFLAQ